MENLNLWILFTGILIIILGALRYIEKLLDLNFGKKITIILLSIFFLLSVIQMILGSRKGKKEKQLLDQELDETKRQSFFMM